MSAPSPAEPVRLIEDEATGDRLLIYGSDRGIRVELRYEAETLWATQKRMAEIFGVDVRTVSEHLQNIFKEGELGEESVVRKSWITAADG
jgi:hypothetical protein